MHTSAWSNKSPAVFAQSKSDCITALSCCLLDASCWHCIFGYASCPPPHCKFPLRAIHHRFEQLCLGHLKAEFLFCVAVVSVFRLITLANCQFGDACLFAFVFNRVDSLFSFEGQLQHLLGIGGFVGVSALMVINCNIAALSWWACSGVINTMP